MQTGNAVENGTFFRAQAYTIALLWKIFKLPNQFKIDTPIGAYNPDWVVYLNKNGEEKLYFVIETKGSESVDLLRPNESKKIHCGRKHF